jgi:hypothetical protein
MDYTVGGIVNCFSQLVRRLERKFPSSEGNLNRATVQPFRLRVPVASESSDALTANAVREAWCPTPVKLVHISAGAVDGVEGLAEVVGDGGGGGNGVLADMNLDGAVAAGRLDEFPN